MKDVLRTPTKLAGLILITMGRSESHDPPLPLT